MKQEGEINHYYGGRGVYFQDPGPSARIITKALRGWGKWEDNRKLRAAASTTSTTTSYRVRDGRSRVRDTLDTQHAHAVWYANN